MYNPGQFQPQHQYHYHHHQQPPPQGYYPPQQLQQPQLQQPQLQQPQLQQQQLQQSQQQPQQQFYPPPGGYQQGPYAPPVPTRPQPPQQQQQQPQPQPQQPQPVSPQQQQPDAELRQWFDSVDTQRTGQISADNLRDALSAGGFRFRAGTAERLIRMFDRDGSGNIEFDEFRAAHAFIKSMSVGFAKRDADQSGVLEAEEIREALAASGFRLSEPAHQLIMRKFGRAGSGGLCFDDYMDLSIILGTSSKVFAFYDRNRSGLVSFDYSTWLVSVLACLV